MPQAHVASGATRAAEKSPLRAALTPAVAWCLLVGSFLALAGATAVFRGPVKERLQSNSFHVLLNAATAAAARGEAEFADPCFQRLVRHYGKREEGLLAYARYLDAEKRPEEASAYYKRAVFPGPQRFSSVTHYAYFLDRQGRRDEAIAMCREYLERHPDDAWAHYELGLRLFWIGDNAGCEGPLQQACENPVLTARALGKLGAAYARQGKTQQAIKTWWRVVHLGSDLDNKEFLYDLGKVYRARGELDQAIAVWQQYFDFFPRSLWTARSLRDAYLQRGDRAATERIELFIRSMSPPVNREQSASPFVLVLGCAPPAQPGAPGASLLFELYVEFLDTISPADNPEVRFTAVSANGESVALESVPKFLGTPPFWRGNSLVRTFVISAPDAIQDSAWRVELSMGPDFGRRVELFEMPPRESPVASTTGGPASP